TRGGAIQLIATAMIISLPRIFTTGWIAHRYGVVSPIDDADASFVASSNHVPPAGGRSATPHRQRFAFAASRSHSARFDDASRSRNANASAVAQARRASSRFGPEFDTTPSSDVSGRPIADANASFKSQAPSAR